LALAASAVAAHSRRLLSDIHLLRWTPTCRYIDFDFDRLLYNRYCRPVNPIAPVQRVSAVLHRLARGGVEWGRPGYVTQIGAHASIRRPLGSQCSPPSAVSRGLRGWPEGCPVKTLPAKKQPPSLQIKIALPHCKFYIQLYFAIVNGSLTQHK